MPLPKKPKSELAVAHILGTINQKNAIHVIANREHKAVSFLIQEMINDYLNKNYGKDNFVYSKFFNEKIEKER